MTSKISRAESDFSARPKSARERAGRMKTSGLCVAVASLSVLAFSASSASAAPAPWWQLSSSSAPAHLQTGECEGPNKPQVKPQCGQVVVRAENMGDQSVTGSNVPVSITDTLPAGIRAKAIASIQTSSGFLDEGAGHGGMSCLPASPAVTFPAAGVTCTWSEALPLPPYEMLEVAIEVEVASGTSSGKTATNDIQISGGEGDVCEKQEGGAFTNGFCASAAEGVAPTGSYESHLTGQEVAPASLKRSLTVENGPTPFGVEEYTLQNEDEGGAFDTQAGSHPFQQTTNTGFNQGAPKGPPSEYVANPPALPKDLHFQWPPGLIGNPLSLPQCTAAKFSAYLEGGANECPPDTAVGVASVTVGLPHLTRLRTEEVPVFNLVPNYGEPAHFGFEVERATVLIDPTVRSGGDYGVTVNVDNLTQLAVLVSSRVTVWGVPGSPSHDASRGWGCMEEGKIAVESSGVVPVCTPEAQKNPPPFLSLPTSCTGPLKTSVREDSWQEPKPESQQTPVEPEPFAAMPALDGCNELPFSASIEDAPDVQQASSPTGLAVKVHVAQEVSSDGAALAPADLKDTTVMLPEGVAVNPSGANGLEACTGTPAGLPEGALGTPGDQIGYQGSGELPNDPGTTPLFTGKLPGSYGTEGSEATLQPGVNFCPDASKIGKVTFHVPVLAKPLEGNVYLASQNSNPFGSLLAMYVVAEDKEAGVMVKLPGEVTLCKAPGEVIAGQTCQALGQLVSTFENTPQAPFEEAEFHFFGGEKAPLAMPAHCGSYTTQASFTPWSGNKPLNTTSSFKITSGPGGGPCPGAQLPFSPSLTGGALNLQAGAFSPFTLTMTRRDGEQNMQSVQAKLPPGLSGILANIELCPEPQADLGECPPNSLIGESTVSVGVGGDPYTVTGGKFYLTGPYQGAPFGLTFEVPAKAGPYDLERNSANPAGEDPCDCVIVRGKIEVNPLTAALTVTSNPPGTPYAIPTSIEGIPLEIQHINATTTRGNFQFNPTSCNKMEVTGTIHSSEGGTDTIGVPFQVTNCASLKFTPKFTVSTSGKTSKAGGADLVTKVTEPNEPQGSQANITKVKVELPLQLPSRLTTLQKACTDKQFEANPAGCPSASFIGHATVHTPLLPVPLTGPAIFVSHGGEAFPSLTMVLQGYGVTIDLVGTTFISKSGITSTTFKTVPDQPFSTFELTLPEGKYSALAANGNLCAPTTTKTVSKKVTVKRHGKSVKVTKKVSEQVAAPLVMPNEFIGQNGAAIHENTDISVTGCPKAATAKKAAKKKSKGKKGGKK